MTAPPSAPRGRYLAHRACAVRGEGGFSLLEQIVAISVVMIVMVIFMSAVVQMTRLTVRVQASSGALDEARRGVDRFDRQLRSADAVNRPVQVGTDWYLEFRTTANGTSTPACTQWRLLAATHVLQFRTWSDVATPAVPAWTTAASGVRNNPATQPPFTFVPATVSSAQQQVTLTLLAGTAPAVLITTTLSARNTSTDTLTNSDADGDGLTDTPVCQQAGRS